MSEERKAKHELWELRQMQSLPLRAKVLMTQQRIRDWYEYFDGQVYVSFSGGKDSTVLKWIVDRMYSDVPSVFANTGLEYPEIRRFAQSRPNVVTVQPKKSFVEVLSEYGYPVISKEVALKVYYAKRSPGSRYNEQLHGLRMYNGEKSRYNIEKWAFLADNVPFDVSHLCCEYTKKEPLKTYQKETGRKPITAIMASESQMREQAWMRTGCNAFEGKRQSSKPMSFWTEQDVLHFIVENNVPYCKEIYGEIRKKRAEDDVSGQMEIGQYLGYSPEDMLETTGADRTGCIFCMFGCHLDKHPNRFERLKETHPKQYAYCIGGGEMRDGKWKPNKEGLGLGKVLDYIGVTY